MSDDLDIPMPRMMPAEPSYRAPRRNQRLDAATKRLLIAAGGIGALLLLVVGLWQIGGPGQGRVVPVVEANARPLRTKPENRGGLQVQGQDDAILSGSDDSEAALAPPPETPAPQTLREAAAHEPAPPKPAGAPSAQTTDEEPAAPATKPPVATPAIPTTPPGVTAEQKAKPVPVSPAAKPASPVVPAAAQVQLAALGTEQAALSEWERLNRKMPDLLGGHRPAVSRTDQHGKTFYRLRTGGFADIAQATAFCERVRAKGAGCSLAAF